MMRQDMQPPKERPLEKKTQTLEITVTFRSDASVIGFCKDKLQSDLDWILGASPHIIEGFMVTDSPDDPFAIMRSVRIAHDYFMAELERLVKLQYRINERLTTSSEQSTGWPTS